MGIAYQRLKRYDEALEIYRAIIDYAKRAGDVALLHMFSNNLAVLYLDLEKPKEACPLLDAAYGPDHPRAKAARERLSELEA